MSKSEQIKKVESEKLIDYHLDQIRSAQARHGGVNMSIWGADDGEHSSLIRLSCDLETVAFEQYFLNDETMDLCFDHMIGYLKSLDIHHYFHREDFELAADKKGLPQ